MTSPTLGRFRATHVVHHGRSLQCPPFTPNQLHTYHIVDRDIFFRLVIALKRDPCESLLVMATWLWLEEYGYRNILHKMIGLPDFLVNGLAKELAVCLECFESDDFTSIPLNGGMPFTSKVIGRNVSLNLFKRNKFTAIFGIRHFLNNVCAKIFVDILRLVLPNSPYRIYVPGFPHKVFGPIYVRAHPMNLSVLNEGLWAMNRAYNVCPEDRSLFITFSRGFPVSEEEVKELFTSMYGDCVEAVYLPRKLPSAGQHLYTRLVLRSIVSLDRILRGNKYKRFRVNGKHVWARKYVPRRKR